MGIIVNATVIVIGGMIGSILKSKAILKSTGVFGICVMIISAIGVIENLFSVDNGNLIAPSLYAVVIFFAIGAYIGEALKLDKRLSHLSSCDKPYLNGFIDSTVFFAVGGLQICGSVMLALTGDSSQLYLKSIIDMPLAMMFGAVYGTGVMLSAIPVALIQVLIAAVAHLLGDFITPTLLSEINAMGYIILFFSGFNLICEPKYKINNTNMIPSIFLIIIYNVIADQIGFI